MTEDQARAYTRLLFAIFGERYDETKDLPASSELIEALDNVTSSLTERESDLIRARFGITDGEAKAISELAAMFDKSEEECRETESAAISKLRHPARSDALRVFLD
jgi:RNA polymerase primary sigma factor